MEWQPIETVSDEIKENETEILIYAPMRYGNGKERHGYGIARYWGPSKTFVWSIPPNYSQNIEGEPTHWAPVQPPRKETKGL